MTMNRLKIKLVLIMAVMQVLCFTLLLFERALYFNDSLQEYVHQDAIKSGLFLNASLAPLAAQNDFAALQETLDAINEEKQLAYVQVLDYRGAQVGQTGDVPQQFKTTRDPGYMDQNGIYNTEIALQLSGQKYGRIQFGIPTHTPMNDLKQVLLRGIVIAILAVIISSILLMLLLNKLVQRLTAINTTHPTKEH
jgi:hypothetical protein